MGDARFLAYYERVRGAADRAAELRMLPDEGVVAALAACAQNHDAYLSNVLATEALNRLQRPRSRRLLAEAPRAAASALRDAMHHVSAGEHLCLLHATDEEQRLAVVAYVAAGLAQGERCVYITDTSTAAEVLDALRAEGVEPEPHVESGALVVLQQREAYLREGRFDPDRMVAQLDALLQESEAMGFRSLRVTGEMTWALGEDVGGERILEYETKLNRFFAGRNVSAICQYDRRRFDARTLVGVVETHPFVVSGGVACDNFYFVPPDELADEDDAQRKLDRLLAIIRGRAEAEAEIVRLNDDLEHMVAERTAQLREVVRELESFSYTVSHDLRAPLRGIDFYAQALQEDQGHRLDEDGRALLGRLRAESQRLSSLVSHLLTLGRVASAEVRRAPLDLSALAREIVANLQHAEPTRRVEVDIAQGIACMGDPQLMRLVLENLLGNAWKFTRHASAPRIRLEAKEVDGETVYTVRDNGAGFDPGKAHRLFNPFSRLHAPTEFEGTGVGLATVARIVRRHGGRVFAEGRPGEGAAFSFTLPASLHPAADPADARHAPAQRP